MSARFSVEADPERDLIRIEMTGFFGADDIAAFLAARREAHKRLTCGPNRHVTLNDLRGMKIQSQDAVNAFHNLLAAAAYRSRRLAFVVSPTLARTQLARALGTRDARFFERIRPAEAWLFEPEVEAEART